MAYYTGTANDFAELRQALTDACVADGWAWDGGNEVLSKGVLFLRIQIAAAHLTFLGRTGTTAGDAPGIVQIGTMGGPPGANPVVFPVVYEVFSFDSEVYLVVNYSIDRYQWAAFGRSSVAGLPGTGMWIGATLGAAPAGASAGPIAIARTSGASAVATSAALMYATVGSGSGPNPTWVHSDLDGQGWWLAQSATGNVVGIAASVPLLGLLPNVWNSEAVLLPIRSYKVRPQNKVSLTADLAHARYTRIDNYQPGQIIAVGPDRWKVFPWYRKNAEARDGGSGIDHTGTFGWAIRYEGP